MPEPAAWVFETIGPGVVLDSLLFVLDRVTSHVVRLRIDGGGGFREPQSGGGRGRGVVGRLLYPSALARVGASAIPVAESDGVLTTFDIGLHATWRLRLENVEGLSGIVDFGEGHWLAAVRTDSGDLVIKISGARPVTHVSEREWLPRGRWGAGATGALPSPVILAPADDSTVFVGSSHEPMIARLRRDCTPVWVASVDIPPMEDLLPERAPANLRNATYRVSSVVSLVDGGAIATLFRPGPADRGGAA